MVITIDMTFQKGLYTLMLCQAQFLTLNYEGQVYIEWDIMEHCNILCLHSGHGNQD